MSDADDIHPIRDSEIESLRENIESLCMALEPSALDGDFEGEADALETLRVVQER